ncbi:phosphoribosylglycinamide formyltransferase [Endozoicomonas sp. OPT23]|uniref:phosphoribosylglycinamide formyltransferase n=1 Tax=Endozoicomonas sp. OPT23 TaxID=2072845 RepID=UPI00129BB494|nr:phosphoribosylglycinamide formyltransferase [Endozoicomonas sp. OPT23]MRI35352.1 phosphoribosylglycinamide formyltransferase [Endozoicomonas sp. OPT23]
MTDNNRIVVLFSGNGSTLQSILDQQSKYQYQTVAAITNRPDAFGLQRAEKADIEALALDHKQFQDRSSFDQALIEQIDQYNPALVVLAGYMRILSSGFVSHYQGRLINIHPSLLPKHKGLNTYQSALSAGDEKHGASVHFVTEELDSGAVILQASTVIKETDTAESLEERVKVMEQKVYPEAIDWIVSGRITQNGQTILLDQQPLDSQGVQISEQHLED